MAIVDAVIKRDKEGLYVFVEGWIARPDKLVSLMTDKPLTTSFKDGDSVLAHHFGGSQRVGVGKDDSCKRGEYLEYWKTHELAYYPPGHPESKYGVPASRR